MSQRKAMNIKALTILALLLVQACARAPFGSTAMLVPPPKDLSELVSKADIIAIGEVAEVIRQGYYGGYDATGRLILHAGEPDKPVSGVPFTDFSIKVERSLKDDGSIAAGQPIILRITGHPTNEVRRLSDDLQVDFPMSFPGDRHLLLLSKNPDGSYGFYYGPWSRLVIDGEIVRVSNGAKEPLKFANSERVFTPAELIDAIEQMVR
jgi:hypothetical protein